VFATAYIVFRQPVAEAVALLAAVVPTQQTHLQRTVQPVIQRGHIVRLQAGRMTQDLDSSESEWGAEQQILQEPPLALALRIGELVAFCRIALHRGDGLGCNAKSQAA